MRVLLRIAYDGTAYCGFQIQPNAITVEEVLTKTVSDLFAQEIHLIGASRTDSGVHALGNVAVFDVDTRMPAEKIAYALNTRLPEDVKVVQSIEVAADFHPRHTDCIKTYEYQIWNDAFENPKMRLYTQFDYGTFDIASMQKACQYFLGTHDFSAFCSAGSQTEDKTRTIYSLDVQKEGHLITMRVTGNGFLYNMVRIIAGTLMKVGKGQIHPDKIAGIIAGGNRGLAGPTAPAKGLTLVKIQYKELNEL